GRTSASPENKCIHSRGVGSCISPPRLGEVRDEATPSTYSLQEPLANPASRERESKGPITYRRPLSRGGLTHTLMPPTFPPPTITPWRRFPISEWRPAKSRRSDASARPLLKPGLVIDREHVGVRSVRDIEIVDRNCCFIALWIGNRPLAQLRVLGPEHKNKP